jgi:hypothetical protein
VAQYRFKRSSAISRNIIEPSFSRDFPNRSLESSFRLFIKDMDLWLGTAAKVPKEELRNVVMKLGYGGSLNLAGRCGDSSGLLLPPSLP